MTAQLVAMVVVGVIVVGAVLYGLLVHQPAHAARMAERRRRAAELAARPRPSIDFAQVAAVIRDGLTPAFERMRESVLEASTALAGVGEAFARATGQPRHRAPRRWWRR